MELWQQIRDSYADLTDADFGSNGKIVLQDDGDGIQYIAKWNYEHPIPEGLTLGKP